MDEKILLLWIQRLNDIVLETKQEIDKLSHEEKLSLLTKTNIHFLLGYVSTAEMLIKKGEDYD